MTDAFDALIGDLYACVLDASQLRGTLERVTQSFAGDTCHLVGWLGLEGPPTLSVSVGLDASIGPDYVVNHAQNDPRRHLALAKFHEGELLLCQEHFDSRFVARNAFYQDYLLPLGLHYLAAVTLVDSDQRLLQIAFQRYAGREAFAGEDVRTIQRIIPHLQRALSLMCTMQSVDQQMAMALKGVEAAGVGLIGVSAGGRVVYTNALGSAFLAAEAAIRMNDGCVQAMVNDCDRSLSGAFQVCLREGKTGHVRLRDHRRTGEDLICTVVPAPDVHVEGAVSSDRHATALCLITRARGGRLATAQQLIDLYRLSPAEARLARAIASGERLGSFSADTGVTLSTVKNQLQSVFRKIGCGRQADVGQLVRAVLPVRPR